MFRTRSETPDELVTSYRAPEVVSLGRLERAAATPASCLDTGPDPVVCEDDDF